MAVELNRFNSGMNTNKQVNPTDDGFFTGSSSTGPKSYDPYISGYAFIFWLNVPTWIPTPDVFKQYSQKNFKSFQGHSNIDLETEGVKTGFSQNETHYTKGIGAKASEFTLKYQEHSGASMSAMYNSWVSGIRDPKTGIATYPKQYGKTYHSSNHTATLLYVVTRPDADNTAGGQNIEFASLWTHVQPKRINLEHFNYDSGSHDMFELDQPFSGVMNIGQQVEKFAAGHLDKNRYNFYSEGDFNNIDMYTAQKSK